MGVVLFVRHMRGVRAFSCNVSSQISNWMCQSLILLQNVSGNLGLFPGMFLHISLVVS